MSVSININIFKYVHTELNSRKQSDSQFSRNCDTLAQ